MRTVWVVTSPASYVWGALASAFGSGTALTIAAIGASPGAHWCSVPPETKIAESPVMDALKAAAGK